MEWCPSPHWQEKPLPVENPPGPRVAPGRLSIASWMTTVELIATNGGHPGSVATARLHVGRVS